MEQIIIGISFALVLFVVILELQIASKRHNIASKRHNKEVIEQMQKIIEEIQQMQKIIDENEYVYSSLKAEDVLEKLKENMKNG